MNLTLEQQVEILEDQVAYLTKRLNELEWMLRYAPDAIVGARNDNLLS